LVRSIFTPLIDGPFRGPCGFGQTLPMPTCLSLSPVVVAPKI